MIKLKCNLCSHVWNYSGSNPYYVTCPHCYTKVRNKKENEVKKETNENEKKKIKFKPIE